MGENRHAYSVLVGKSYLKIALGKHGRSKKNKIKVDLKGTGFDEVDWICLIENRESRMAQVTMVMNFWLS
jgi:hypothetical protein